ncbi:hypothetical protein HOY80DRAFT_1059155 [Tuber brumale]|nr:hypothetical protein HOY80DRAFT_1059155 [Tuber brumale]
MESQTFSDTLPPQRSSFPGPEELDRGEYTVNLLIRLEANQTRFRNNRKREEDYRVSAGELPPFRRAIGEDVDDPPSPATDGEDEDSDMPDDAALNPDFWSIIDPTGRSPTEYPPEDESLETTLPLDMRPRVRPENLYRRPVSIPGFPPQPLTQMRPAASTPTPQAEPEGRTSRAERPATREGQSSAPRTRSSFFSTAVYYASGKLSAPARQNSAAS